MFLAKCGYEYRLLNTYFIWGIGGFDRFFVRRKIDVGVEINAVEPDGRRSLRH